MNLQGKKIIIGVTGSIAAYKAAILIRHLVKEGAEVRVIMTKFAKEFITPLTLATLSKHPILVDFYNPENGDWNNHVDLGEWADAYLIAPATANTMGKMVNGIADNLLLTVYLSARCPVFVAPAMDLDMYKHPSTQKNIEILQSYGNHIIEPASGELASGLLGKGRMEEPDVITNKIIDFFQNRSNDLKKKITNKHILISAGPTHEPIDPVRFIGNRSSGKMGYAIANLAAEMGANVTLVSGPVNIAPSHSNIKLVKVNTAEEMYQACVAEFPSSDIGIMAAAVADFTPKNPANQKIKKKDDQLNIDLKATKDILLELGKQKTDHQTLVGFALETNNEQANALSKLQRKNLDFIVLNSLQDKGAGFEHDTNRISILDKNNNTTVFELKDKRKVAIDILSYLEKVI